MLGKWENEWSIGDTGTYNYNLLQKLFNTFTLP